MFGICYQRSVNGRLGSLLKCCEGNRVNDNVFVRCMCRLNGIGCATEDVVSALRELRSVSECGVEDVELVNTPVNDTLMMCKERTRAKFFCTMWNFKHVEKESKHDALELLNECVTEGDELALCDLGVCYYNGDGVPKDIPKAIELWKCASDMGNVCAMYQLGGCYYNDGVPEDLSKAIELWKCASDMGYTYAMHSLGVCYKMVYQKTFLKQLNCFNVHQIWVMQMQCLALVYVMGMVMVYQKMFVKQLNYGNVHQKLVMQMQ